MSEQKPISEQVMEKLATDNIEPKAKWHYQAKQLALWTFGFLFVLLGGLAVAVMIFMVRNSDWDIYQLYHSSFAVYFLSNLPYVWFGLFILLIFVVDYNIKKTKKGYRYTLFTVSSLVLGATMILGGTFYAVGMGERLNQICSEQVPYYNQVIYKKAAHWTQPEVGRIGGQVKQIYDEDKILLHDLQKKEWVVINIVEAEKFVKDLRPGVHVRILGTLKDDKVFYADVIMPFTPRKIFNAEPMQSERIRMHLRSR
jgi:hypothetical protein